jgi:hypothetical protein
MNMGLSTGLTFLKNRAIVNDRLLKQNEPCHLLEEQVEAELQICGYKLMGLKLPAKM